MGTIKINGHTYKTIEGTAPQMTKEQMEQYTAQVGQFGSVKDSDRDISPLGQCNKDNKQSEGTSKKE